MNDTATIVSIGTMDIEASVFVAETCADDEDDQIIFFESNPSFVTVHARKREVGSHRTFRCSANRHHSQGRLDQRAQVKRSPSDTRIYPSKPIPSGTSERPRRPFGINEH